MAQKQTAKIKLRAYEAVTIPGVLLWTVALVSLSANYRLHELLIFLALVPLVVSASVFPNIFPLPAGLKFAQEKVTFTPSDSIVLLVACWYGPAPAIFIAGVEGFISSRRAVRRLSSNIFSFGMMSLVGGASSMTLGAVLRYGFGETVSARQHSFPAVAVALLVANTVHIVVNTGLVAKFFALRQGGAALRLWRQNLLWAAPNFLPTSAVASVLYITLQYNALLTFVIGTPILAGLYLVHRQHRNSVQARIKVVEQAQQERITMMEKAHCETIEALAVAINAKDQVTHEHVLRVQIYAAGVARLLGCSPEEIEALKAGALLHDVGKIAVPDYILKKPGKLTAAEFDKMKLHTVVGAQILSRVEFPYPVVPVVRHHHERWDGKGYPDGLQGEAIPLTARILSVVDCFDAVREDRQYRKAMTREEAINFIMQGSGSMYDPRVVGTFITHLPEFEAEIVAHRDVPAPTFGIEQIEQLSEAALRVAPAAGLAETAPNGPAAERQLAAPQQAKLAALAQALKAAPTLDELVAAFLANLNAIVPYETCALTRDTADVGNFVVTHAAGEHGALLLGRRIVPGEGVTGWTLVNRKPFYNADPKLDVPASLAEHFAAYGTLAACPLMQGEELQGVVTLYAARLTEYTPEQQQMLTEAMRLLATALATQPTRTHLHTDTTGAPTPAQIIYSHPTAGLTGVVAESELAH
jgi:putative nucleotidyltransferase with HDIG domain